MNKPQKNYLSVTEINSLIKDTLEESFDYWLKVRGEISSFKIYPSAVYFDIKDERSVLNCIMWNSTYKELSFSPKIGDLIDLEGKINVYVARGRYSFIARSLLPAGQGDALLKLERLKKKLADEGLFDEARKRPINPFPKTIGIICARGSAALSDLIKNLGRRWPLADIVFFPSLVQGDEAPSSLLKAFSLSQTYPLDTLIVARGGGSNEDLSAFNDEKFVRALANSKMPTISAVGHEIDVTLVDYVSDLRVSTPTGAAEAATPNQEDIMTMIAEEEKRILLTMERLINRRQEKIELLSSRSFFSRPIDLYKPIEEKITSLKERLNSAIANAIKLKEEKLNSFKKHLSAINPYAVLNRGYGIIYNEKGTIVRSINEVENETRLNLKVKDGIILSKVEGTEHE